MGTPKHPGNEQADPSGRSASADLPKRLREAGFKTIDLKAGYGFHQTSGDHQAGPSGSLTSWLRRAKPLSYVLIAARVTDDGDLNRMIADTTSMTKIMDGMGLFCFIADDPTAARRPTHRARSRRTSSWRAPSTTLPSRCDEAQRGWLSP